MIIPGVRIPETLEKHEFGLWVFDEITDFGHCSACGSYAGYSRPSNYCPDCGALMINGREAVLYYDKLMDEYREKTEKEKAKAATKGGAADDSDW